MACPRHPFQRSRNDASRAGSRGKRQPLRLQQPDAGIRLLPGLRPGASRRAGRHRRRRVGLERLLQPDAGGACRVPAATRPLRRWPRQPSRCAAVGDARAPPLASAGRNSAKSRSAKMADLAFFKLDELRFSGHGDPLAALVLCGAHRADRVMIGGRWVVEGGEIPGLDIGDLMRRHGAAARRRCRTKFPRSEIMINRGPHPHHGECDRQFTTMAASATAQFTCPGSCRRCP